jgi:hypothetical protein
MRKSQGAGVGRFGWWQHHGTEARAARKKERRAGVATLRVGVFEQALRAIEMAQPSCRSLAFGALQGDLGTSTQGAYGGRRTEGEKAVA